jgi:hypothetical protein
MQNAITVDVAGAFTISKTIGRVSIFFFFSPLFFSFLFSLLVVLTFETATPKGKKRKGGKVTTLSFEALKLKTEKGETWTFAFGVRFPKQQFLPEQESISLSSPPPLLALLFGLFLSRSMR